MRQSLTVLMKIKVILFRPPTKFAIVQEAIVAKIDPPKVINADGASRNHTRPDTTKFLINSNLIGTVEETPDTVLTLTDGRKMIVLGIQVVALVLKSH